MFFQVLITHRSASRADDGVLANASVKTLDSIKKALEEGGVEFIGTPDHQPGVRLK